MTHKQLRELLERHRISQAAAARAIGIAGRTMRAYIAGDLEVPVYVEMALHTLIDCKHEMKKCPPVLISGGWKITRRCVKCGATAAEVASRFDQWALPKDEN